MSRFPDANRQATFRLMAESGVARHRADSLSGSLDRPRAMGQPGGRVAGPESLFDFWINVVGDPSEALARDPDFRTKLRMHPDCAAACRKREVTVAGFPDRVEPNPHAKDKETAKEIAEYVESVWRRIPNVPLLYQQMQSAVIEGGIGFEWLWHREATGVERPASFHSVHKSRFLFDRLGNLALRTREHPVWGEYIATTPGVREDLRGKGVRVGDRLVDPRRFVYHVHRLEAGTWERPELEGYQYYGVGEEVALYYLVTFDVYALKGRMKWLERYGDPALDVYYPDNAPDAALRLAEIGQDIRSGAVVTIPRLMGQPADSNYEIKQRDVPHASYDAFAGFSDGWTLKRINALLLGQAEESQQNTEGGTGGSYSSHASRKESGPDVFFKWDAGRIESTLNVQLIPHVTRARYPNLPDDYVPVLRIGAEEERDRDAEMKIVDAAAKYVPVPKRFVYEASGIPEPDPHDEVVGGQGQPGAPGQPGMPPGAPGQPQPGQPMPQGVPPQPGPPVAKPAPSIHPGVKAPVGADGGQGSVAHGERPGAEMARS